MFDVRSMNGAADLLGSPDGSAGLQLVVVVAGMHVARQRTCECVCES